MFGETYSALDASGGKITAARHGSVGFQQECNIYFGSYADE